MYILSGRIAVISYDPNTDQRLEEKMLGPNDFVFVPSKEPHSMRNLSATEDVTFLCCIANIYEEEGI
jgi:mannose-6-phosphate isomerase-like protein (cupin superfamily)